MVEIILSKRAAQVGELFDIKVIARARTGLSASSWFLRDPSVGPLVTEHVHEIGGQKFDEHVWEGISVGQPGTYRFAADCRDVLYDVEPGVAHRAAQGAGFAEAAIEVREDISYAAQVDVVAARYGMSSAWQTWMKSPEIRARYEPAWERSRSVPTTIKIAFHYGDAPLAYDPPWESERQHMEMLDAFATLSFPSLGFDFLFGADPATTDAQVVVGGLGIISSQSSNDLYLYYETIFAHEFGHLLNVPHHYEGDDFRHPIHLPPFESRCTMARNANRYCSGCLAAMHLDLSADTSTEVAALSSDIFARYPY